MHPQYVMPPSFPLGIENMTQKNFEKFLTNILWHTAPALVVFFGQLEIGVTFSDALPVAMLAFWGVMRDYFSKKSEEKKLEEEKTKTKKKK